MASDTKGPPSRTPHPDATESAPRATPTPSGPDDLPISTSSEDVLSLLLEESIKKPKPDPSLGDSAPARAPSPEAGPPKAGVSPGSFDAVAPLNAFTDPHPVEPVAPAPHPKQPTTVVPEFAIPETPPPDSSSSATFDPLAVLGVEASLSPGSVAVPEPASFDAFPGTDLSAPPTRADRPKPADEAEDEEYEDDDRRYRRLWLAFVLVLSYASAVTIGLAWIWWTGRRLHPDEDEASPPAAAEVRADPGARSVQSRRVITPPPIPADRVTTLGRTIRVGDLEVTPLRVTSGLVLLRGTLTGNRIHSGGDEALKLRLRLKNVSEDSIFAPLDEGFLRERGAGPGDSLVEADGRQIEMYPLAVASELAVVGQAFRELEPGQSYETQIVTAPDSAGRTAPEMTWRLRLRTGIERTDTIGVRFRADEVKPGD
jgi:hypothetical protein